MNEITLKTEKIDWLKLIDLAFKRKDWGKKHTLYHYGTTSVTCVMKEFNFENSTAWFRLTALHLTDGETSENSDFVRYALNNFSLEDFKIHLGKKITSLLKETKNYFVRTKAKLKYKQLRHYSFQTSKEQIIKAGFQEELNAINELDGSLKDDCIDLLKDRVVDELNKEFKKQVAEYIKKDDTIILGFDSILEELRGEQ